MRQIKFRGKRLDNGKWATGDLIHSKNGKVLINAGTKMFTTYAEVNPDTVGQFTGLLDKNGKEIYEDDIVQADYITTMGSHRIGLPVEVRWCNQEARWVGWDGYTEVGLISPQKLVVKGNLFDNTELI